MSSHLPDLAHTPAGTPPPGQVPNFVNPPSQQGVIIAVSIVMMILTLLAVSLRLFASFRVTRAPGAEDYICLMAMILSFVYSGFTMDLSYVARHMWDVPLIWFTDDYWKIRFTQNVTQSLAFFASRLPILLLYLRLFGLNIRFRLAVYAGMVFAFAVYLIQIPLISVFCTPRSGQSWNSLDLFAKCKEIVVWAIIQGSGNVALDIYIFVLPLPTISGLQLPKKRKMGVIAIFAIGFLAVIGSVVGLYYRCQLSYGSDINWNEGAFIATASVEINIAIICSSMPACSSLAKHLSQKSQNSGFLGSLRSLFSTSRVESKHSTDPSGPTKQSQHLTDSKSTLPKNSSMELNEVEPYSRTHQVGGSDYHQGIIKTVAVDIV